MVCENISDVECVVQSSNEETIRLLFLGFYMIVAAYMVLRMNQKTIRSFGKMYVVKMLLALRYFSIVFLSLAPMHFMIYSLNVSQEIYLGWYMLFYVPLAVIGGSLLIVMGFDWIFQQIGFDGVMDFYTRIKNSK